MKFIRNNFGYTMMEMMVVISLVGIFSSMAIVNFRVDKQKRDLNEDGLKIADALTRVQNMALVGEKINNYPPEVYAFVFESGCPGDCFRIKYRDNAGIWQISETLQLKNNSFSVNFVDNAWGGSTPATYLRVEYLPPRAKIKLFESAIATNESNYNKVVFTITNGPNSVNVRLDKVTGLSYLKN